MYSPSDLLISRELIELLSTVLLLLLVIVFSVLLKRQHVHLQHDLLHQNNDKRACYRFQSVKTRRQLQHSSGKNHFQFQFQS